MMLTRTVTTLVTFVYVAVFVFGPHSVAVQVSNANTEVKATNSAKSVELGGTSERVIEVKAKVDGDAEVEVTNDANATRGSATPTPASEVGNKAYWDFVGMTAGETRTIRVTYTAVGGVGSKTVVKICTSVDGQTGATAFTATGVDEGNHTPPATQSQKDGDPLDLATGQFFMQGIPDLDAGGVIPLVFSPSYFPRLTAEGRVLSALGPNWVHNYDLSLFVQPLDDPDDPGNPLVQVTFVDVVYLDGQVITFVADQNTQGNYLLNHSEEIIYQLQDESGTGGTDYWLMDPIRDLVVRFDGDLASASYAMPLEVYDRNGNRLILTYDANGQLTQVTDNLGGQVYRTLTFAYDANGNLTSVSDVTDAANPRTVTFAYDPANLHLTGATDPLSEATSYAYAADLTLGPLMTSCRRPESPDSPASPPITNVFDAQGRVTQQTDGLGNVVTLQYAPDGGLAAGETKMTDAAGSTTVTHADKRLATKLVDRDGNTIDFGYGRDEASNLDDFDRVRESRDRMAGAQRGTTGIAYHAQSGKIAAVTNADGKTITYTYTAQQQTFGPANLAFTFYNLTRVDYPDNTNEQFVYDAKGNVTQFTDRAGKVTTYTYNAYGQVLTVTNPTNGVVTYTYNADGTLASATDSDAGIGATTYAYDDNRRANKITHPNPTFVQYAYDKNNRVTSYTDERSSVWQFQHDGNGNLKKIIDPATNEISYTYDVLDRLLTTTDWENGVWTQTYDALGRLASLKDPTNMTVTYGYTKMGWLNQVTHGGKTWQIAYDNEGVPSTITTPLNRTITYQKNILGYVTGVTNHLNQSTGLTRDVMSRVTKVTDPRDQATDYAYDSRGLLTQVTKPVDDLVGVYTRSDLGQLTNVKDPDNANWGFEYSNMGRPTSNTDPLSNVRSYTYDSRGRVSELRFPDHTEGNPDKVVFTYDGASNVTRLAFSGGPTLDYSYDSLNRLATADGLSLTRNKRGQTTRTTSSGVNCDATYDAAGRLKTATCNGMTVTYTYDGSTGLLTQVSDGVSGAQVSFTYDDDRRLTGITRGNGVNTTYTWDDAGRMTRVQDVGTGSVIDLSYQYDAAGRQTQATLTTVPLDPADYLQASDETITVNAADQVTTTGYSYDARGQMTGTPGPTTYTYDKAGRLTGIASHPVTMAYNGLSNLLTRTEDGTTIRHHYNHAIDMAPIVAEQIDGGAFQRYYVWSPGGALLYMVDAANGNAEYYYHADKIGSTLALSNQGGTVTDKYCYGSDGRLLQRTGSNPQPFTFVGRWGVRQEGDSGLLYHMRARYYDAKIGQFLTRDPVWPIIADPRQLNPYQYAAADPLRRIDPTGEVLFTQYGILLGFAIFGGILAAATALQVQQVQNIGNIQTAADAADAMDGLTSVHIVNHVAFVNEAMKEEYDQYDFTVVKVPVMVGPFGAVASPAGPGPARGHAGRRAAGRKGLAKTAGTGVRKKTLSSAGGTGSGKYWPAKAIVTDRGNVFIRPAGRGAFPPVAMAVRLDGGVEGVRAQLPANWASDEVIREAYRLADEWEPR